MMAPACIGTRRLRHKCLLNQFDLFDVEESGLYRTACIMADHGNFTLQGIIIICLLKDSIDLSDRNGLQSPGHSVGINIHTTHCAQVHQRVVKIYQQTFKIFETASAL